MKKIIFSLLLIFSIFFISCDSVDEPILKDCKITFVNALNDVVKEYTIKEGENVVYPTFEEMLCSGYRFLDSFDKDITVATASETIKGNYIKVWTVNFYNELNELISSQTIDDGNSATSPKITLKEGYTFKGWKTDFSNVKSDLEIYGDFELITYNFKYSSNLDDAITCNFENDTQITLNTIITLKAKEISEYNFLGFYENDVLLTTDYEYTFEITSDRIITAEYAAINLKVFEENGVTFVYFGSYPQTLLEDTSIINALNQLQTDEAGYVTYNNVTYCKITAKIQDKTSYKSLSGKTDIKHGQVYYFIVEPIKWRVISTGKNTYELFSEFTLDVGTFFSGIDGDLSAREIDGKTIYANNYKYSDVRNFLNNVFYNTAFSNNEKEIIQTTLIDNSSKTGLDFNKDMDPTAYACEDTLDNVYLLSYKDYQNKKINKQGRATDYAIAKGCWVQKSGSYKCNAFWWLRTPNPAYPDVTWFDMCSLVVDEEGIFDWNLFVVYDYIGYRPTITTLK